MDFGDLFVSLPILSYKILFDPYYLCILLT